MGRKKYVFEYYSQFSSKFVEQLNKRLNHLPDSQSSKHSLLLTFLVRQIRGNLVEATHFFANVNHLNDGPGILLRLDEFVCARRLSGEQLINSFLSFLTLLEDSVGVLVCRDSFLVELVSIADRASGFDRVKHVYQVTSSSLDWYYVPCCELLARTNSLAVNIEVLKSALL